MSRSVIFSIVFVLSGVSAVSQTCDHGSQKLKAYLVQLVLSDDNLILGHKNDTFEATRTEALKEIDSLIVCSAYALEKNELIELKRTLESVAIKDRIPQGEATRVTYTVFSRQRDAVFFALGNHETRAALKIVQDSIDTLASLSRVRHTQLVKKLDEHSPLYLGINWYTHNGLGFSAHYHFRYDDEVSALGALSLLYHWQDEETETFGVAASGGVSVRLSGYNRIGFLAEASVIDGDLGLGGRIMGYTQYLAVGMGYTKYMGAGIALLIRFHDPR